MNGRRKAWKKPGPWIFAAAIGLVGFALGRWMPTAHRHEPAPPAVSGGQDTTAESGLRQVYTCSMHPQVRSPNPDDKCPICGMDLIPVPMEGAADQDGDLPRLQVTPRAAALMQIEVRPVEARDVRIPIRLYGRIGYDETRLRTIAAYVPGRLDRLYVDFTGTSVRRGQPMAEIYSPTLMTAQEEHLQAIQTARELDRSGVESVREATRLTVSASHDRLRLLGLDAEQIRRIEAKGRVDERLVIPAPLTGVVIERLAAAGDYVETGQPIYRLADLSRLWVELEVYESDLPWLKTGQKAVFDTQSYPGERFEGKVAFIDPVLNDRTRTVRVRVDLPNPEGRLKPRMFVRGVVEAREPGNGLPLVIPATAPLVTGERAVVYVEVPEASEPTFEAREVVLGPRAGAWYIVREGLAAGERVVTHGGFKIDAELQIRGRPSMMQPEGGPPPTHDHGAHAAITTEAP
jgi:Cu(I)/Ag(I) efflux system membrane fusion protein